MPKFVSAINAEPQQTLRLQPKPTPLEVHNKLVEVAVTVVASPQAVPNPATQNAVEMGASAFTLKNGGNGVPDDFKIKNMRVIAYQLAEKNAAREISTDDVRVWLFDVGLNDQYQLVEPGSLANLFTYTNSPWQQTNKLATSKYGPNKGRKVKVWRLKKKDQ